MICVSMEKKNNLTYQPINQRYGLFKEHSVRVIFS